MLEKLLRLKELNDSVKGTREYGTYLMENDAKVNGRWVFIGHGVPCFTDEILSTATIKKVRDNTYIMCNDERWRLTDEIRDVLGIR